MMNQPRRILFIAAFCAVGILSEIFLWQTGAHPVFIVVLSPVLYLASFIESKITFLSMSAISSELIFVVPLNLLYFGLIGYWFKRIIEEPGIMKYFLLFSIFLFLVFLHWQAALGLKSAFPLLEGLNLPDFWFIKP